MKYIEEYLKDVIKVEPLGELTTKDDELNGMSGEMVYINGKCSNIFISHADYVNWLEKQGENKSIINVPPREVILSIWALGNRWEEITNGIISTEHGTQLNYIQNHWHESDYYLREKQGEQKPFDYENANIQQKDFAPKQKPKFKIGDWIAFTRKDGTRETLQVSDIIDGRYYFNRLLHFSWSVKECDEKSHLWTIQDAKDGDVLAFYSEYRGNKMVQVGIIEKYVGKHGGCSNTFKIYVGVNWDNNLQIGKYMGCSDIRPATKEQRDLLFQKMKEAGYKWENDQFEEINNKGFVDLGLPSGTLWAKCNLGTEKETDFGLFYQWGDTQGYSDVDEHQFNWDDYKYGNYDSITKYNNLDNKLILDNEDDPMFAATNGKFKMPTKEQLQELIDCTNHEWTNIDGVNGMKFWKKGTEEPTDGNSYIFIPAAGYCYGGSRNDVGSWGYVWSASRDESFANLAWRMYFDAGDVGMGSLSRCDGYSVRAVVVPQAKTFDEIDDTDDGQPVDLGLPSGTKWMKSNIGATKPSDFGKFFQWGDTQGYSGIVEHQFSWEDYKWGNYNSLTKYNNTDHLTTLGVCDDSAVAATGGQASMPTKAQLEELRDNTEHRWLRLANGVNGMKFWKKGTEEPTDGNSYIFIPAADGCYNGSRGGVGSWGYVWSASRDESGAYGAWSMYFDAGDVLMSDYGRCSGCSVRGVVAKNI